MNKKYFFIHALFRPRRKTRPNIKYLKYLKYLKHLKYLNKPSRPQYRGRFFKFLFRPAISRPPRTFNRGRSCRGRSIEADHIEAAEVVQSRPFFSLQNKNVETKLKVIKKLVQTRKLRLEKMKTTFLHLILKCHPRA